MTKTVDDARARLERAALAIGDLFAAEIDPEWDECQELEASALAYRNAVREEAKPRPEQPSLFGGTP